MGFPNRVGGEARTLAKLAALVLMAITRVNSSNAAGLTNVPGIQSLSVNGTLWPIQKSGRINLGTYPANIVFGFGPGWCGAFFDRDFAAGIRKPVASRPALSTKEIGDKLNLGTETVRTYVKTSARKCTPQPA